MLVLATSETTARSAARAIALGEHQEAVAARAARFAAATLEPELADAVRAAAKAHDEGKRDPRWQTMVGGSVSTPLAKGPGGDRHERALPRGWRHEMRSAADIEDPLIRHLVGAHHGYGRPTFPAAPDLDLWRRLASMPTSFLELQSRYGPWALAYLETLVRLADRSISEEEQA